MVTTDRLRLIIPATDITLLELIPGDAHALSALVRSNRENLPETEPTTLEAVRESVVNPANTDQLQLGIWFRVKLAGVIRITPGDFDFCWLVSCWIGANFSDQDFAVKATQRVLLYGKQHPRITRMVARVKRSNQVGATILKTSGMKERPGNEIEDPFLHFYADTTS